MKSKQKIYLFGNCNIETIATILRDIKFLRNKYEIVPLKQCFMCTADDAEEIYSKVSEADIFITQITVSEHYKNLGLDTKTITSFLPKNAKLIKIPVPYFTGYFPEQFYLHDKNGITVAKCEGLPHPYHNKIIFWGYCNKLSPTETLKIINSDKTFKNLHQIIAKDINELKTRETELDIKISQLIKKTYKRKRLFWTINHPTNFILKYISFEIVKILIGNKFYSKILQLTCPRYQEFLDCITTPIMPSVKQALQLRFKTTEKMTEEIIKQYYSYYDNNPDLIEPNTKEITNLPLEKFDILKNLTALEVN